MCKALIKRSGQHAGQYRSCGKTFPDRAQQAAHCKTHGRSMTTTRRGKDIPTCLYEECATKRPHVTFASHEEQYSHFWTVHGATPVHGDTPIATYCAFCNEWLYEPHEWLTHAKRHVADATAIVKRFGYGGAVAGRTLRPRLCPFCFHDESLPTHMRLTTFSAKDVLNRHMKSHLRAGRCLSYPTMCTLDKELSDKELKEHLDEEHHVGGW